MQKCMTAMLSMSMPSNPYKNIEAPCLFMFWGGDVPFAEKCSLPQELQRQALCLAQRTRP